MRHLPLCALLVVACGGGGVDSKREAELAYLGLDGAVSKAIDLGFDGFNAAHSANIDPQSAPGDVDGTLTVTGQVDQGSSDNKGMRLDLALDAYRDVVDLDDDPDTEDFVVTYWTDDDTGQPALDVQLKDIPDGTLAGTLIGDVRMEGDLEGPVSLDLAIDGPLESDGAGGTRRVPGATAITGTATGPSGAGWPVDVVR